MEYCSFQSVLAHALLLADRLVRRLNDRQSIVGLHVRIASGESDAKCRHRAVHPLLVSHRQRLAQPIAHAAAAQFEFFSQPFADQQGRGKQLEAWINYLKESVMNPELLSYH